MEKRLSIRRACDLEDPAEFLALHPTVQTAACEAYQALAENPARPSLRFKKLAGYANLWPVRVEAWIGSHNDFDKRFG